MTTTLFSRSQHASRGLAMVMAVAGTLALAGNAPAQSNWINTTTASTQSWGTAGNWSPGAVPSAADAVVNITSNIAADQVITISTTSRTVGTLNIGDPDGSHKWNLTRTSPAVLIFDVSSGSAALNLLPGARAGGYQMNTPVQLNDDLVFTINVADGNIAFNQPITESGGDRTFTLTSTVVPSGINTFAGVNGFNKLVVSGNAIFNNNLLASDRALGKVHGSYLADAITLNAGTLRAAATGNYTITVNRGVTLGSGGGTLNAPAIGRNWVVDSIITGSGGFTKSGPGDATLNAANTYLGPTTVTDGTLFINGDQSLAIGTVTVGTDPLVPATLAGTGTAGGDVTFASGSKILFGQTTLTVGGTISFGGSFGIADLVGLDATATDGTYQLLAGTINSANLLNVGEANAFDLGGGKEAYFTTDSGLGVSVVPEPGTGVAVATSLAAAICWWCKRRPRSL